MHFHFAERKFMDDNGKLQKKTHYVKVVQFMINILYWTFMFNVDIRRSENNIMFLTYVIRYLDPGYQGIWRLCMVDIYESTLIKLEANEPCNMQCYISTI